jgi:hypothetical protein
MAYTQADADERRAYLAALREGLASPELVVTYRGRATTMRSVDELLKAIAALEGELATIEAALAGTKHPRAYVAIPSMGL